MATNTFIVSDETINCYGCIVLTAGINTARFERNPVMYYMHDRDKGVIGRWENIRKDGTKLLADAVFDDGTELGAKVKHQVETGFLRTASVGLENIRYEEIDGVKTIVECDLYEISIVDVPANENAVKLYAKGRKPVTLLSQLATHKESKSKDAQTLRVRLIDVLGLADTATDNEIVTTVKELLKEPSNAENEVVRAIERGLISDNDRESFTAMAMSNIKAFRAYCSGRKNALKSEIETLLRHNRSKVHPMEEAVFRHVGERLGIDVLREILGVKCGTPSISGWLDKSKIGKSRWSLEDYRKYAPQDLIDNPALYERLVAEKYRDTTHGQDLAYYRKHNPEYLATHPDFYRQLIENEQKTEITMALNKQVWLNQIQEGFYPDDSFLQKLTNYDAFVENDKIHIASAGIDPKVVINNTTYPIAVVGRDDDDFEIELDKFETENTIVRRPDAIEYSYDKLESVIRQHRSTLHKAVTMKATHAIAPQVDTFDTPLVTTSGTEVNGRLRLTFADILALKERFDDADIPQDRRYIVLHPKHVSDLLLEDIRLFKDLTNIKDGEPLKFAGFGCFSCSTMPTYSTEGGKLTKVQYGGDPTTAFASVAFYADEVFKADGEIHMYATYDDPKERATIVGFDKRSIVLPIRGKGIGAIVSKIV